MKWYKYKTVFDYSGECLETCLLKKGNSRWDIKIGSNKCSLCEHCKEYDEENNRIKCSKIKEATKERE